MTKTKEIRHFRKPARSGTCSTAIYILGRGCRNERTKRASPARTDFARRQRG